LPDLQDQADQDNLRPIFEGAAMLKTIFDTEISLLTPLHIGNGETLALNFEYAVHDRRTWVIHQEHFAGEMLDKDATRFQRLLDLTPPGQLLQKADFREDSGNFRYVMPGVPRSAQIGAAVQSQIKDVADRPYLPGSSLKGALRTIIVRHAFAQDGRQLRVTDLNRSRSWAAQRLERNLLGRSPNYDLLRALQVSDSTPGSSTDLLMLNAQVFGQRSSGAPIALECVRADAQFSATLTIDEFLFSQQASSLHLGNKREWLVNLAQLANEQAAERIKQELTFYGSRAKSRVAGFYRQVNKLLAGGLPAGSFLLQVGWGGGWNSKTLGYLVPDNEREAIIQQYRLAKGQRKQGDAFPKSRRAVAAGPLEEARPMAPLGWLLLQLKERQS
jgi:CRISPR-associated protein Csm5